jgi:hypothetical protein
VTRSQPVADRAAAPRRPVGVGARLVRVEFTVAGRPRSILTTLAERDERTTRLLGAVGYVGNLHSDPRSAT